MWNNVNDKRWISNIAMIISMGERDVIITEDAYYTTDCKCIILLYGWNEGVIFMIQ